MNPLVDWLLHPHISIARGEHLDYYGKPRREVLHVGAVWELHLPGYFQLWYDGPIHNVSLGVLTLYAHTDHELVPTKKRIKR